MTRKLFLISAAFVLTYSTLQAMDQLPHEVIEHGIIPQMDKKTLENFGSTSTENAAAVGKYRKDEEVPPDIILACPRASEVIEALSADTPRSVTDLQTYWLIKVEEPTIIGSQRWSATFSQKKNASEKSNGSLPTFLKEAKLMEMRFGREAPPDFAQAIRCNYRTAFRDGQGYIQISRSLFSSNWRGIFQTCKPTNPAYEAQVALAERRKLPQLIDTFVMQSVSKDGPLPDGLEVICAQEKKMNIPDKQ